MVKVDESVRWHRRRLDDRGVHAHRRADPVADRSRRPGRRPAQVPARDPRRRHRAGQREGGRAAPAGRCPCRLPGRVRWPAGSPATSVRPPVLGDCRSRRRCSPSSTSSVGRACWRPVAPPRSRDRSADGVTSTGSPAPWRVTSTVADRRTRTCCSLPSTRIAPATSAGLSRSGSGPGSRSWTSTTSGVLSGPSPGRH